MEQLIILIIFYVLYAIFSGLSRKLKSPQPPPKRRFPGTPANRPASPPATTLPGGTPATMERRERPAPTMVEEEEPEIELPPFLREMLGMDKPPQPPQPLPRQEVVPAKVTKEEAYPGEFEDLETISLEQFEKAKVRKEYEPPKKDQEPAKAAKIELPAVKKLTAHPLREMLRDKNNFKKAFILKEVLDAPISKRRGKNPYSGRV